MHFISMLLNMEFTIRQRQDNFKAFEMILTQHSDGADHNPLIDFAMDAYFPYQGFQVLKAVWKVLKTFVLIVILTQGLSKIRTWTKSQEREKAVMGRKMCGVCHQSLFRAVGVGQLEVSRKKTPPSPFTHLQASPWQ